MEQTISLARSEHRVITRAIGLALVLAIAFLVYYALGTWLWHAGFISTPLLFLAEKMAIANSGAPSRIIGAAFVYPPLALAFMAPFHNPIVGQAALGAIVDGMFILWTERHIPTLIARRLTQVSFLASGVILYTAIEDSGALIACELAALAAFALLRFFERNYSPDLFAAGTFVGLTFFIDFRIIALAIVFVPTLVWTAGRTSRDKFVAVLITLIVPSFLMALGWTYVNWIFIGDPFAFARGPLSFFHVRAAELPVPHVFSMQAIVALALMLAPVWCAPYALRLLDRRTQVAANFMLLASLTWAWWCTTQTAAGSMTIWLIPLGTAIAFAAPRKPSILIHAALLISVAGSWLFLSTDRADAGSFYGSLIASAPVSTTSQAAAVHAALAGAQNVLMDDAQSYGVVALDGDAARFVLPYSKGFARALNEPERFADHVVVSTGADDRVLQRYPNAAKGVLPGYHLTLNANNTLVFTRNSQSPDLQPLPVLTIPLAWHVIYIVMCALLALATIAAMHYTSRELTGNKALQQ